MNNISYRVRVSLMDYYVYCARCPFKDVKAECERAQGLKRIGCYNGWIISMANYINSYSFNIYIFLVWKRNTRRKVKGGE